MIKVTKHVFNVEKKDTIKITAQAKEVAVVVAGLVEIVVIVVIVVEVKN